MKYTFIMQETNLQNELVGNKLTSEFNADTIDEILEKFQYFLKGSGFFFDGTLRIDDEEESMELETTEIHLCSKGNASDIL